METHDASSRKHLDIYADKAYNISRIRGGWLTVNRACNLRCGWCYQKDTEVDLGY